MAIFKRKRTKNGTVVQDSRYTIQFTDHTATTRRLPAFENRRASEAFLSRIETLVSFRLAGQTPDNQSQQFIDTLSTEAIDRLADWGILSENRKSASVLVEEHIEAFEQSLRHKGCSENHIKTIVPRIKNTLKNCKVISIQDISINSIQRYVNALQLSEQTKKHYVRSLRGLPVFC